MDEREQGTGNEGSERGTRTHEIEDHEFIRRVIESMVDAERDLDVLFFDGVDRRGEDEDKPEMEDGVSQEDGTLHLRPRVNELGDSRRVGTAQIVLRDIGREAAIQRAARAFHDDSLLMDSGFLRSSLSRSRGVTFTRSSPHPAFRESRLRDDECGSSSSSTSTYVPQEGWVSSRKIVLDEIQNGLCEAPTPSCNAYDPPLPLARPPNSLPRGYLYCGARFRGTQRSRNHRFDVEVVIQNADLAEARLYGTIHTKGLTAQLQELTTFFHGEIISEKHSFITNKWDADVEADRNHWHKFAGFKEKYGNTITSKSFDYSKLLNDNVMYMRWKEHYLVNESSNRDVTGASFAGFYYIALDEVKGEITGLYYHRQSEMYQLLSLKYVDQTVFDACEIR